MFARRSNAARIALIATTIVSFLPSPLPAQESQPATQPAETLEVALKRLRAIPHKQLHDRDIALRTGIQFLIAAGTGDTRTAVADIDATGFQPLPLTGDLPEAPAKPLGSADVSALISDRMPRSATATFSAESVALVHAKDVRQKFPAIAKWMLPTDYAVLISPVAGQPNWVRQPACIVVRVRGTNAKIMGGNLFSAVEAR